MKREEEINNFFPMDPDPDLEKRMAEKKREASLKKGEILKGKIKIFNDAEQFNGAAKQFRKENDDLARKLRHEANKGCMSSIDKVPLNYKAVLNDLLLSFPNFEQVILKIKTELSLAQLTKDKVFHLETPLLLVGPAGVGKTYFLNVLAERLGLLTERVSCSDASAGFVLSGLSAGFATGQPGLIYKTVVGKRMANPIIILDEIDKSGKDSASSSPSFENVFYNLLEPISASNYKDECMLVEFDASHICWFATANDLHTISAPIRDRFDVVEVPYPSEVQRRMICKKLYSSMITNHAWGKSFSKEINDDVISLLTSEDMSVRQLKRSMYQAFARAADENEKDRRTKRKEIKIRRTHFTIEKMIKEKSRIGFIH